MSDPRATRQKHGRQRPKYPASTKLDVVDDYHGVRVADPYRWLEDADSSMSATWVEAQNALTRSLLPSRTVEETKKRLHELYNYPRGSVPVKRRSRYFFTRNSGLQDQPVLYVQEGVSGRPRALLDPNALSPDATVALTDVEVNDAGTLVAYALSTSGSDRQEIFVRDAATGRDRADRIRWAKFTSVAWLKDSSGFYYTRFPEPGTVPPGDENYYCRVFFHGLGQDQSDDTVIFERPDDRDVVFTVEMTSDGRHLIITALEGATEKSEVYLLDPSGGRGPTPLFTGFAASYTFIASLDARLFFRTDSGAPLGRIIAVDLPAAMAAVRSGESSPGAPGRRPTTAAPFVEVVPETDDKLSLATIVHDTLVASYLHHARSLVRMFDLAGKPAGEIGLPGLGSVSDLTGRPDHGEVFLGYTSFVHPPTNYRYDFEAAALFEFGQTTPTVDPAAYEARQVWYPSRDGTHISMFVVHRKGLARDGQRPVLLSGYGGFNISMTPAFDPALFVWLDRGGVFALPNLRGGGEYGEAWHQAGMLEKKQNVFDDLVAAAEWLIANRYTSSRTLAIEGGSNGGLLVGAAMIQRPALFGAVICRVPVADMLRYHRLTVGRFWIPEYGSSDDREQFRFLIAYSPYHNVSDGTAYPATLITTADTDDRVAPGMAKKFAARLQEATAGPAPILIRVETRAGHGVGKPTSKLIDEEADIFTFLLTCLDVRDQ